MARQEVSMTVDALQEIDRALGRAHQYGRQRMSTHPTKAVDSVYERDITKATTSDGLTFADFAWHAKNTYGFDCDEVVSREFVALADHFIITCSNGLKLRVYLRPDQHPRITNMDGRYA